MKKFFLTCSSVMAVAMANAQLKIGSVSDMNNQVKDASSAVVTMAQYVVAAVLGVALIFVIYALATSSQRAKEYLIGWIIAVVVCLIAKAVITGF
ncbi:MAG: hypothetical protein MJZ34_00270 [Paludibacteraceae bacterium]|nr:hypothetical protein [Paludibacteraceae bacterium]